MPPTPNTPALTQEDCLEFFVKGYTNADLDQNAPGVQTVSSGLILWTWWSALEYVWQQIIAKNVLDAINAIGD